MEAEFRHIPGVVATAVGYSGGATDHPTYEQVCRGGTGHAEAVLVEFDPARIPYAKLLDAFWANHSSTHLRKGQYRSAIFTFGEAQAAEVTKSGKAVEARLGQPVATEIRPAGVFWLAEDYHQQYYEKTGIDVCPAR